MEQHARRPRSALVMACVAFVVANVAHGIDHQRQGIDRLTTEVLVGGTILTLLALSTLWLVLRRHPRAPLVAAVVGFYAAVAVVAAHIAPHWSAFSDPYPDLDLDAVAWIVMLAEVVAALALSVAGVRALRREARPRATSSTA